MGLTVGDHALICRRNNQNGASMARTASWSIDGAAAEVSFTDGRSTHLIVATEVCPTSFAKPQRDLLAVDVTSAH